MVYKLKLIYIFYNTNLHLSWNLLIIVNTSLYLKSVSFVGDMLEYMFKNVGQSNKNIALHSIVFPNITKLSSTSSIEGIKYFTIEDQALKKPKCQ